MLEFASLLASNVYVHTGPICQEAGGNLQNHRCRLSTACDPSAGSAKESGQGIITEERLKVVLADPHVQAHMRTLDLDVHEGAALFHLLDAGL